MPDIDVYVSEHEQERRFEQLFEAYRSDMVAYCGWRAGSPSDAQDAVADVWLAAWRRLDNVPDGDAARVWLYATARKVIANQRRSRRRRVALHQRLSLEVVTRPQAEAAAPLESEHALVHEALRRLGTRDREVLLLAEWDGLTASEIGHVLGCLTVTARGRLHRARSRFRATYEELSASRTSARATSGYLTQPLP